MNREFLSGLDLGGGTKLSKDVIDSIMAENGKDIEAVNAKYAKYADYDTVKAQLKTANDTIKSYKDMDIDGIKQSVEDYKSKYEKSEKDSKAQIEKLRFDNALELAMAKSGVKSTKALRGFLDTEKIKLDETGALTGFSEQIEAIKKDNDYLFGESQIGTGMKQGSSGDDLSKLSDDEYYAQVIKAKGKDD